MTFTLAEIVVVGLASARLYQLLAHDTILERPRGWLDLNLPKVSDWLLCPWCAGFWLTLATFGVWFTPFYWLVYLGAAAELTSLFGLFANRLAEHTLNVELENVEILDSDEARFRAFEGNGE